MASQNRAVFFILSGIPAFASRARVWPSLRGLRWPAGTRSNCQRTSTRTSARPHPLDTSRPKRELEETSSEGEARERKEAGPPRIAWQRGRRRAMATWPRGGFCAEPATTKRQRWAPASSGNLWRFLQRETPTSTWAGCLSAPGYPGLTMLMEPSQSRSPLATISMRQSSETGTSMFMSAIRTSRATGCFLANTRIL